MLRHGPPIQRNRGPILCFVTASSRKAGAGRIQGVRPFEQIVESHGGAVLRVCRSLLGPTDAEDAWSETFLAALRAYPEIDPRAPIEAWLVTIARNKAIDMHRARKRRPVPVAELPELPHLTELPASARANGGLDTELWDELAELPPKQLRCVVYHHLGGLRYSEIAEMLGGSEAAARRAAADGIAALRKAYRPGEPENSEPGTGAST